MYGYASFDISPSLPHAYHSTFHRTHATPPSTLGFCQNVFLSSFCNAFFPSRFCLIFNIPPPSASLYSRPISPTSVFWSRPLRLNCRVTATSPPSLGCVCFVSVSTPCYAHHRSQAARISFPFSAHKCCTSVPRLLLSHRPLHAASALLTWADIFHTIDSLQHSVRDYANK